MSEGADVNGTNPGGQTALILAALMGRADIVRLLLDAGADVRRRDNLGLTAIDWSQRKGFSDVTHILVSFSTKVRSANPLASNQVEEDQGTRAAERVENKTVATESGAREIGSGSQPKSDGGFGPAAIAMLKAKAKQSNHEPEVIQPLKENAATDASLSWTESFGGKTAVAEPESLRARMETERIFEEARQRVEQEVRKKTQEQTGAIIDKESFEESSSARKAASESPTLKRCLKCNTIYDDDFRMYCAYDAGRLVNIDQSLEGAGNGTFGRSTLWVLVGITLIGSVIITYLATTYLTKQEVSTLPAAAATEQAPITEENLPIVGGALIGKELNVPKADYPSTARNAGTPETVTVVIRVNRSGRVTSARALNGDLQLRAAAEKAARKATFSPEKLAQNQSVVAGTITYTFKP